MLPARVAAQNAWCKMQKTYLSKGHFLRYYHPYYFIVGQFSKFIRPGAVRIGHSCYSPLLEATAFKNPNGSLAVVVYNLFLFGPMQIACMLKIPFIGVASVTKCRDL